MNVGRLAVGALLLSSSVSATETMIDSPGRYVAICAHTRAVERAIEHGELSGDKLEIAKNSLIACYGVAIGVAQTMAAADGYTLRDGQRRVCLSPANGVTPQDVIERAAFIYSKNPEQIDASEAGSAELLMHAVADLARCSATDK